MPQSRSRRRRRVDASQDTGRGRQSNTRLKAFEQAIERGELLVIVDVPRGRVAEITERITKAHPKAEPKGTEPRVPAFP